MTTATIAVLGASGAIGRFLLPRLDAAGHTLLALSRQPPPAFAATALPNVSWLRADLHGAMPALVSITTLYSLGPLDALVAWLERAPPPALRRVIAFSSMSAESKRNSDDATERDLARRLHDSEQRLLAVGVERGIAVIVFRPTLIYGAGLDRSLTPLARFAQRWRVMPVPLAGRGLRQPVHAADLAEACVAVLDRPQCAGRIYALGGGERLSFRAVCRRIAAGLPGTVLLLPLPTWLLRAALRVRRGAGLAAASPMALARLRHDLIAEHAAAEADFGYAPRTFHPGPDCWPVPGH